MKTEREFRGNWWLPDGQRAGGVATYHPEDGIELELFSQIKTNELEDINEDFAEVNRIFGHTTDNKLITLKDCLQTGVSHHLGSRGDNGTETYVANQLFVGDHLEGEIVFDRFRLSYPLLYQWSGVSGLTQEISEDNDINIRYNAPSARNVELDSLNFKLLFKTTSSRSKSGKMTIEEEAQLEFEPQSGEISYDSVNKQVSKWGSFFSLALGENIIISKIIGYKDGETPDENQRVEILYPTTKRSDLPETIRPNDVNFTLQDIDNEFESVIQNWDQKSERYKSAYDLYFSVVYNSQMYLQNQYVTLFSALEGFHREKQIDQDGGDKQIEHSLIEKLEQIVNEYSSVIESLPWETNDNLSDLVTIRNKAIHGSVVKEEYQKNLYDRVLLLRGIIEAVLLSELGIPQELIQEKLKSRYESLRPQQLE